MSVKKDQSNDAHGQKGFIRKNLRYNGYKKRYPEDARGGVSKFVPNFWMFCISVASYVFMLVFIFMVFALLFPKFKYSSEKLWAASPLIVFVIALFAIGTTFMILFFALLKKGGDYKPSRFEEIPNVCPQCNIYVASDLSECPKCGHEIK